ncbi:MAG: 23S rRNA (uracil(1939)-C(5))-methyltransferase RlmD [Salinisphaeraceae bacterium]|nr:23S rRNA (uracil(1939)-C(5))-methyltransferase RlmD [Salinisphaeraceae bacterium]
MAKSGRRRRRHQPDGPFEAEIHDLAQDARGVGRVDDKVVFIADALPGEKVSYMRTRRKASFDEGRLEAVIHPSPDRVEPGCQHFGLCGGCSLQHLSAEAQIQFKQSQLLEALQRIGHVQPRQVAEPLSGPLWQYRRRARLTVKDVPAKGRVLVGFRERGNPFVAMLERCEILQAPVGELLLPLSDLIGKLSIRDRLPQIEVAVADNAVALVLRVMDSPSDTDIELLKAFSAEHELWFYLQPGGLDTVKPLLDNTPELLCEVEPGLQLAFAPTDFLQINGELNRLMIQQAMDWLQPNEQSQVLELFCGLGNFSLPIARRAASLVAVEGEAGLIARAKSNAASNSIDNASFFVADLFEDHGNADWIKQSYDMALIDPPRAGAEAAVVWLAQAGIPRIVYVSCHPATLARDADILVNTYGYQLERAGVMDMFPHTQHVESMALFTRA